MIVGRKRPHLGIQLSSSDADDHRFQAILTDRAACNAIELERDHRARVRCQDRIRCAEQMGLKLLPSGDFEMNAVWVELALCAWANLLVLRGELSGLEPKQLRYSAMPSRWATLQLERRWPILTCPQGASTGRLLSRRDSCSST